MKYLLYIIISLLFIFTVWQYYAANSNKKYNSMNNKIIGNIDNIGNIGNEKKHEKPWKAMEKPRKTEKNREKPRKTEKNQTWAFF